MTHHSVLWTVRNAAVVVVLVVVVVFCYSKQIDSGVVRLSSSSSSLVLRFHLKLDVIVTKENTNLRMGGHFIEWLNIAMKMTAMHECAYVFSIV